MFSVIKLEIQSSWSEDQDPEPTHKQMELLRAAAAAELCHFHGLVTFPASDGVGVHPPPAVAEDLDLGLSEDTGDRVTQVWQEASPHPRTERGHAHTHTRTHAHTQTHTHTHTHARMHKHRHTRTHTDGSTGLLQHPFFCICICHPNSASVSH